MFAGIVTETLNDPSFKPVELVLRLVTSVFPGSQAAQPAMLTETGCGGTQLCPIMVTVPPVVTVVVERSITGGLDVSTVKGPSSWLLAILLSEALKAQIL